MLLSSDCWATTANLRPDGDTDVNWNADSVGVHYDEVDEDVTQPTAGDSDVVKADKKDSSLIEQYTMTTQDMSGETCTEIVIWMYAFTEAVSKQPTLDIYDGTDWVGVQTLVWAESYTWTSKTFGSLSWNQTQVDALQVKFTAYDALSSSREHYLDTVYAVITYEGAATRRVMIIQ